MASTSTNSLFDGAQEVTARRNRNDSTQLPPAVAAHSPLHEVLIDEVAAPLPAPLAARLRAMPTVGQVQDWIAAGAVYSLVADDPYLARRFLEELDSNPRLANLALAKAYASRMEPPPRDARWYRMDRWGLFLQVVVATLILLARGLLFGLLGRCVARAPVPLDRVVWLRSLLGLDLIAESPAVGPLTLAALAGAALWLGWEAIIGARIMEDARQLPARWRSLPPPLSWRADGFYLVWYGQAVGLLALVVARCFMLLGETVIATDSFAVAWSVAIAIGVSLIATIGAVARSVRATLSLGTKALGRRDD
jgi:hypothetical protein